MNRTLRFTLVLAILLLTEVAFGHGNLRSNTMRTIYPDMYAADLTGDGNTEWIYVDGPNLHISTMEIEPECLANLVFKDSVDVDRVVTGHFFDIPISEPRDQLCAIHCEWTVSM